MCAFVYVFWLSLTVYLYFHVYILLLVFHEKWNNSVNNGRFGAYECGLCRGSGGASFAVENKSGGRRLRGANFFSLCETFVSGGFFTLFHCSIPRVRNPGNHHTRESLKGFLCVHFSPLQRCQLSQLSLYLSFFLSLSHTQLWVLNVLLFISLLVFSSST